MKLYLACCTSDQTFMKLYLACCTSDQTLVKLYLACNCCTSDQTFVKLYLAWCTISTRAFAELYLAYLLTCSLSIHNNDNYQ